MGKDKLIKLIQEILPSLPESIVGVVVVLMFLFITAIIIKLLRVLVFSKLKSLAKKSKTEFDDKFLEVLHKPLEYFIYLFAFYLSIKVAGFSIDVESKITLFIKILGAINSAYLAFRFVDLIELSLLKLSKRDDNALDDQFVLSSKKIIRFAVMVLILILVLENFGVHISGIITGLGIGGLAIALAAQDTISNLFGSLTVLFDKPFQVGDYVTIDGNGGTVERIGLRSTKIRTIEGFLVSVPNNLITGSITKNISERETIRVDQTIGLVYATPSKDIKIVIEGIKKIISLDKNTTDVFYVFFSKFNDFSLDVSFTYYISPADYWLAKEVENRINFEIMELCNVSKAEMAFPTSTIELKKLN